MAMLAATLLASAFFVVGGASTPASAATWEAQCQPTAFDGGGQGARCQVTVENFLDLATGAESSRVTSLACNAGYDVAVCTGTPIVQNFDDSLIDVVNQCNYVANGGGSSLRCSVVMINTIIGEGSAGFPTVNQCNNSFDGVPAIELPAGSSCNPPQATTGAPIVQCNDSMNGETLVSMNCTVVDTSRVSSALPVTINQCNNSVNGGGSLLECSTNVSTIFVPAADNGGDTGGDTGGSTPPSPDELAATGAALSVPALAAPLGALLLGVLLLIGATTARRRALSADS